MLELVRECQPGVPSADRDNTELLQWGIGGNVVEWDCDICYVLRVVDVCIGWGDSISGIRTAAVDAIHCLYSAVVLGAIDSFRSIWDGHQNEWIVDASDGCDDFAVTVIRFCC